jgi:hypothetical protein
LSLVGVVVARRQRAINRKTLLHNVVDTINKNETSDSKDSKRASKSKVIGYKKNTEKEQIIKLNVVRKQTFLFNFSSILSAVVYLMHNVIEWKRNLCGVC